MLNVDKSNKKIRTNLKKIENRIIHFINTLDNHHLTEITIAEDRQIKGIHKISHEIDIVDQTVKRNNIEITIQDQTQTKITTQITLRIVHTQTPEKDIIRTTVLENPHTKETETTQTIGIDNIQITDHETIQTIDQTITIITIDHVTILKTELLINQIDNENILNQRIEIFSINAYTKSTFTTKL